MIFTLDDYFILAIFFISFALYVTFESPLSEGNIPAHIVWKQLKRQEGEEEWTSGEEEEEEGSDDDEYDDEDYGQEYDDEEDDEDK